MLPVTSNVMLNNTNLRRSAWEVPTRSRTDEVAPALLLDLMYRSLVRQEASLTASAGHPVVRTPRLDGFTAQKGNTVAVPNPRTSPPRRGPR
jgi:hypothetical protein